MRIKLKDFQLVAADGLLDNIAKMRYMYDAFGDLSATCLQAPTGSGKTVISADVIETLFFGSDERGVDGDEKSCVLWISESPNLNAQTLNRFISVSDRLADSVFDHRHVETIGNDFCASHEELERHKVYFLSKDLLGKGKLLTKGGEVNGGRTFWDVLDKTVKDPERHLYLFIDEAHRGLGENKSSGRGTPTIYANLIDGVDGGLPMPVVVGVSATPQRFEQAMMTRPDRNLVKTVDIKPSDVQASGLLKDTIELRVPSDDDQVEHQYVDMACERFDLARQKWSEYCAAEGEELVVPLLVMQVRDGITDEALRQLCDQVMRKLPDLSPLVSFAHVFGSHTDITPGGAYVIPYVTPETVTDMRSVQVLFAKEAVSNGWDCPRAEVIFSQRRRSNPTYITQLIGRMVRTPLARRVDSNETLNSVACYLSDFDPGAAQDVVDYLTGKKDDLGVPPVSDILLDPVRVEPAVPRTQEDYECEMRAYEEEMERLRAEWETTQGEQTLGVGAQSAGKESEAGPVGEATGIASGTAALAPVSGHKASVVFPRPKMPKPEPPTKRDASFSAEDMAAVRAAWDTMVVERVPKGSAKNPFTAMLDAATLMMDAGWDKDAGRDVREDFCKRLDALMSVHDDEYAAARRKVEVAEMEIITIDKLHGNKVTYEHDEPVADDYGVELAACSADKLFGGKDLVKEYRKRCRMVNKLKPRETNLRLAAVSMSPSIVKEMQDWAKKRRDAFLEKHRLDRDYLGDALGQEYDRLQGESGLTVERRVQWPSGKDVAGKGKRGRFARYPKHILQGADGFYPADLNDLEAHVLCSEMLRANAVAFYRNPEHARTPVAFSVNYFAANGNRSACHPDFVFFMRDASGKVVPAIVDGHGAWMDDALAKLKGYVVYIRNHPGVFAQFVSVSDLKGTTEYRAIDLRDEKTQETIMGWSEDFAEGLYRGECSFHYGDADEVDGLMKKLGVK